MNQATLTLARALLSRRVVLWSAFGVLLTLMLVLAFKADFALKDIERRNTGIRQQYLARDDLLDRLRANLYKSGVDVRDYLLESDELRAEERGEELKAAHRQMITALDSYSRELPPEESASFAQLRRSVDQYWAVLNPVIGWNLAMRLGAGDAFLREDLVPRREQLLALSEQISSTNSRQLAGSEKQVSAIFNEFRRQIVTTAVLTVLVGFAVAAFSIRRILSLERTSEIQYREVSRARSELRRLSARLVATQEEERRRLSRELHDEVGQSMSALLVELSNVEARIREGSDIQPSLSGVRQLAENCVDVIRNMALLLRPSMLDDLGLVPALRWQAREVSRRTRTRVKVDADGVPDDLPDEHRTCVYRIIQEALHNATRHANAQSVRVHVRMDGGHIVVEVQDDGTGFDPGQEKGMGIIGMKERVGALGGEFKVTSGPGAGTKVAVQLPLQHVPAADRV